MDDSKIYIPISGLQKRVLNPAVVFLKVQVSFSIGLIIDCFIWMVISTKVHEENEPKHTSFFLCLKKARANTAWQAWKIILHWFSRTPKPGLNH
jgi:hypothetical protein